MTSIALTVSGATAKAAVSGVLTAGMAGIPVTIEYDDAWKDLTKHLVCRCGKWSSDDGETRTILNIGQTAAVAHEVMQSGHTLYLGIEGRSADGSLVMSTVWAPCGKIRPGANADADPSASLTPPLWSQLQTQIRELQQQGVSDERIGSAVESYFTENPVEDGQSIFYLDAETSTGAMSMVSMGISSIRTNGREVHAGDLLISSNGVLLTVRTVNTATQKFSASSLIQLGAGESSGTAALTTGQINALDGMFKVCVFSKADVSAEYSAFRAAFGLADSGNADTGGSETHTHTYTSAVTTAAACTVPGVRTYTCACGDSYTEEIPATGHSYADGVCTVCGGADPDWEETENNGWTSGEAYAIEWTDGYALDGTTGAETESANISVSAFLPCQGASRLATANLTSNYQLWYYDADKNFLRRAPFSYVVNQTNIETYRDACFVRTTKRLATANASVTPYLDDLLDVSTPWEAGKFYRLNWTDGIAIDATTGAEATNANSAASALALCYGAATLQFSNAARSFITWYDSDKQFISQETRQNVTTAVSVPDGAYYFRLFTSSVASPNFWVQLS